MSCSPWLSATHNKPRWGQQRGRKARGTPPRAAPQADARVHQSSAVFVSRLTNPGWRSPCAKAARVAVEAALRATQHAATQAALARRTQEQETLEAAALGTQMRAASAVGDIATVRQAIGWTSRSGLQKVDLNARVNGEESAIYLASRRSHVEIVAALLRAGATPPEAEGYTVDQVCALADTCAAETALLRELESTAEKAEQAVAEAELRVRTAEEERAGLAAQLEAHEQEAPTMDPKMARKRRAKLELELQEYDMSPDGILDHADDALERAKSQARGLPSRMKHSQARLARLSTKWALAFPSAGARTDKAAADLGSALVPVAEAAKLTLAHPAHRYLSAGTAFHSGQASGVRAQSQVSPRARHAEQQMQQRRQIYSGSRSNHRAAVPPTTPPLRLYRGKHATAQLASWSAALSAERAATAGSLRRGIVLPHPGRTFEEGQWGGNGAFEQLRGRPAW